MAPTPNESYTELEEWLRSNGLTWVADQVDEEIALGRRESRPVEVYSTDSPLFGFAPSRRKRPKKEKFVSIVPYSEEQKLDLMLNAIRTIVAGSILMQEHLLKVIDTSDQKITVQFVPGDRGDTAHALDKTNLSEQLRAARELDGLVGEARQGTRVGS